MQGYDAQTEVDNWHVELFPNRTILGAGKKLLEEASELHIACKNGFDTIPIANEIADVAILCNALASMIGFDLDDLIRDKLAILSHPDRDQKKRDLERKAL